MMILPDLVLPSRVNQRWRYSGMDSPNRCLNKKHFKQYPHHVEYVFNSRGLRDLEWPDNMTDLKQAIWCVGDSFTVGLGQPFHHTWPQVLQDQSGTRTINVSMDGASNQWILRRAQDILREVNPRNMVVMWTYSHRRELPDEDLDDEQRRVNTSTERPETDFQFWLDLKHHLNIAGCNIIQTAIPEFAGVIWKAQDKLLQWWDSIRDPEWPPCPMSLEDLFNIPAHIRQEMMDHHRCWQCFYDCLESISNGNLDLSICMLEDGITRLLPVDVIYIHERLDLSRDHHHFDILTAKWVAQQILPRL